MRVTDELEIAPKPTQSDKSEDQQSVARDRMNAPQPINVTNSYIPPQSNRGMSITVNTVGHRSGIGGCIHTCLLSLSIIAFIGISFLFLFVDFEGRQNLLEEFVNFAGHLMRTAARWLLWLANTIAPQYTEFW